MIKFLVLSLVSLVCMFPASIYAAHDIPALRCLECHKRLPFDNSRAYVFAADFSGVCKSCHKRSAHTHPVEAVPSMPVPADMLLDGKGRLTCATCHAFHMGDAVSDGEKTFLLRRQKGKTFCYSCHTKL
ncbi:MAG: cytochrome c3 family protein [Nitrospirae bacterium]|nr:cytochrome c3 family protein [Nitrospirota bacterium]